MAVWQIGLGIFLLLLALSFVIAGLPKLVLAVIAMVVGILVLVGR